MDPARNALPSAQQLRWFGLSLLLFCVVVGVLLGVQLASARLAGGFAALGCALAAFYYGVRALRLPMLLAWLRITHPLGGALSTLLLGAVYFGVLTPTGLVARMLGRDRLRRRFDPATSSYWSARGEPADAPRYLRQS